MLAVYGAKGQLGSSLMERLKFCGSNVIGFDLPEGDITDRKQVINIIKNDKPDVIINASAYTAVDHSEKDETNAYLINKEGPAILAEISSHYGIPLIHISTDYVFDGKKDRPYVESDQVDPIGVYGKSKAAGEDEIRRLHDLHIIIRTAWLYGVHGNNFVKTMIRLGREKEQVKVVDDQFGSPTYAGDLADAICRITCAIDRKDLIEWGTYHYCGAGETTWFGFAQKIFEMAKDIIPLKVSKVVPIKTNEFPTIAKRPAYSVLSCEKIKQKFNIEPKPWEESLRIAIRDIINNDRAIR